MLEKGFAFVLDALVKERVRQENVGIGLVQTGSVIIFKSIINHHRIY